MPTSLLQTLCLAAYTTFLQCSAKALKRSARVAARLGRKVRHQGKCIQDRDVEDLLPLTWCLSGSQRAYRETKSAEVGPGPGRRQG